MQLNVDEILIIYKFYPEQFFVGLSHVQECVVLAQTGSEHLSKNHAKQSSKIKVLIPIYRFIQICTSWWRQIFAKIKKRARSLTWLAGSQVPLSSKTKRGCGSTVLPSSAYIGELSFVRVIDARYTRFPLANVGIIGYAIAEQAQLYHRYRNGKQVLILDVHLRVKSKWPDTICVTCGAA